MQYCELYDPVAGNWTNTANMHRSRGLHQASLLPNGIVLISGGGTSVGLSVTNSTEMYDPSKGTWTVGKNMHVKRLFHTATVLTNGNILVTGGIEHNNGKVTNTTELYNSSTTTWTSIADSNNVQSSYETFMLESE